MLTGRDLLGAGWPEGPVLGLALAAAQQAIGAGTDEEAVRLRLRDVWTAPAAHVSDACWGAAARALLESRTRPEPAGLTDTPVPLHVWGGEALDPETLAQMETARRLPIAVAAAQMPDGHVGYGLPIGGVLATRGAVIPYGVGVDIACRMKITITDVPAGRLAGMRDRLRKALLEETAFGMGAQFKGDRRREHDVMDDPLWGAVEPAIRHLREKAWSQLGTSGSGNHFVEWGDLVLEQPDLGLKPGRYIALLSHSGSRGFGAMTARHYTDLAIDRTRLEGPARRLAWLELDSDAGEAYWNAMTLAGHYAAANHELIHRHVLRAAGIKPLFQLENHHNFAWIERHGGEDVVVHRKGATPAGAGVLGVIPGSMADPGFIVRGKGDPRSLDSAAHGVGRAMSRKKAKETLTKSDMKKLLKARGVELLAAGIDEAPMAYKPILEVMAAQRDLVEVVAEFHPRIVRMADDGTAED